MNHKMKIWPVETKYLWHLPPHLKSNIEMNTKLLGLQFLNNRSDVSYKTYQDSLPHKVLYRNTLSQEY